MIPALNLLILELDVKQGKYGCFEAIMAPTVDISWCKSMYGQLWCFAKAKLTLATRVSNLKSHDTSPKSTYTRMRCQTGHIWLF